MSLISIYARTHAFPALAGRVSLRTGDINVNAIVTITTGTGTIGYGWTFVRE